jgi:predicted transposase/invertase (TIGR01784 family)
MLIEIDPKVDYAFKRVFGHEKNKDLLIHLLNAVLDPPPGEAVAEVELLNPFSPKDAPHDKQTILDVRARDQSGRQFNVEMQMISHARFPQRMLFYWADLHRQQLVQGEDYTKLRPTVSICFLNDRLFPSVPEHHLTFRLLDQTHGLLLTGDIAVHLLEVPKFSLTADRLSSPLDRWLYFLKHAGELDDEDVPVLLGTPEIRHAMEELKMLGQTTIERINYENRVKAMRDMAAYRETGYMDGHARGLAEGLAEGLTEGLTDGELIGTIRTLQSVLKMPVTPQDQLRGLSTPELNALAEQLRERTGA